MKMIHWNLITPEEQIKRWEHVNIVLSGLTPHEKRKHFYMGDWAQKTECGTIACAAGFCGFNPWFRRNGFTLKFVKEADTPGGNPVSYFNLRTGEGGGNIADYVAKFFGHSGSQAIFYNGSERPVSEVVKEVKDYIKELKRIRRGKGLIRALDQTLGRPKLSP